MPQATYIHLIRHGQSAGNAEGRFGGHGTTPLSDLGREQAEKTAKVLAKERINAIYSSDLLRALQTAEPLGKLLKLPVHSCPEFREDEPMNDRLTELEVRVAFQEQTLQDLNEVVTRQQRELDRLTKELEAIKSRLTGLAPSMVIPPEDEKPPPHY